jgi:BlaI family transcriptional regulator, penicillinase repressor
VPAPPPQKLTRREREIMDALFEKGEASAEEVRERLIDRPSYSAVRAMLVRLEAKGHIRHREEGLRYVYAPTTSPATARRTALKQYARTFFGGSVGGMITSLLRQESWTEEELDALHAEIERARQERTQERKKS